MIALCGKDYPNTCTVWGKNGREGRGGGALYQRTTRTV